MPRELGINFFIQSLYRSFHAFIAGENVKTQLHGQICRRNAAFAKPQNGDIFFIFQFYYLSFSEANESMAKIIAIIQNLMVTFVSVMPSISK